MGIGAYDPWIQSHANPEQALAMADHAKADVILPMHFRTFRLSQEPLGEPIERLVEAVGRDEHRVVLREVGEQWGMNWRETSGRKLKWLAPNKHPGYRGDPSEPIVADDGSGG